MWCHNKNIRLCFSFQVSLKLFKRYSNCISLKKFNFNFKKLKSITSKILLNDCLNYLRRFYSSTYRRELLPGMETIGNHRSYLIWSALGVKFSAVDYYGLFHLAHQISRFDWMGKSRWESNDILLVVASWVCCLLNQLYVRSKKDL